MTPIVTPSKYVSNGFAAVAFANSRVNSLALLSDGRADRIATGGKRIAECQQVHQLARRLARNMRGNGYVRESACSAQNDPRQVTT